MSLDIEETMTKETMTRMKRKFSEMNGVICGDGRGAKILRTSLLRRFSLASFLALLLALLFAVLLMLLALLEVLFSAAA